MEKTPTIRKKPFEPVLAVSAAIQIADPWDKALILRLGHYNAPNPVSFVLGEQ
jgi:hypothetical protein